MFNSHLSSLKEVVGEEKNGQLEILDPFLHSTQYGLAFWGLWNPLENFFFQKNAPKYVTFC